MPVQPPPKPPNHKRARLSAPPRPPGRVLSPVVPVRPSRAPRPPGGPSFTEEERPTKRNATTIAGDGQYAMKVTAIIADMPHRSQKRTLELVEAVAPMLDGMSGEAMRRFVSVVVAVRPLLKGKSADGEKRVVELLRCLARLEPDAVEALFSVASVLDRQTGN